MKQSLPRQKVLNKVAFLLFLVSFLGGIALVSHAGDQFVYSPEMNLCYGEFYPVVEVAENPLPQKIPNLCEDPCTLTPPNATDYELLATLTTGYSKHPEFLPKYLLKALLTGAETQNISTERYQHLIEYIYYEDLKNLILLITHDSMTEHPVWFRYHFIEELTGIQYDHKGYPMREERGTLLPRINRPAWMGKAQVERVQLESLITIMTYGLGNKDPRIRLMCIQILKEIGPTVSILKAVQHYGGLVPDSLETVGTAESSWFVQEPKLLTRRYCFCDLDGVNKPAVPFLQFAQLELQIKRFQMVTKLEHAFSYTVDDFKAISAPDFFTLMNEITILGYYGLDRVTQYTAKDAIYPIQPEEFTIPGGLKWIPAYRYTKGLSSFTYQAQSILHDPSLPLGPDLFQKEMLTEKQVTYFVDLYIGALENPAYTVRLAAAQFLDTLYRNRLLNDALQEKVVRTTLRSRLLREVMKDLYIVQKINNDHKFLDHHELDDLREDIVESDWEWQREWKDRKSFKEKKEYTPIKRNRSDDGTPLPQ